MTEKPGEAPPDAASGQRLPKVHGIALVAQLSYAGVEVLRAKLGYPEWCQPERPCDEDEPCESHAAWAEMKTRMQHILDIAFPVAAEAPPPEPSAVSGSIATVFPLGYVGSTTHVEGAVASLDAKALAEKIAWRASYGIDVETILPLIQQHTAALTQENERLRAEAASPKVSRDAKELAGRLLDATDCTYEQCTGGITTQVVERICDSFLEEERTRAKALRKALDGVHDALGESRYSDDDSLGECVAELKAGLKELDRRWQAERAKRMPTHDPVPWTGPGCGYTGDPCGRTDPGPHKGE